VQRASDFAEKTKMESRKLGPELSDRIAVDLLIGGESRASESYGAATKFLFTFVVSQAKNA
jgi:hypothetical protein